VTTELETRALAGLEVNATIEQVDRVQPAKLENAAQATSIPGIDLASLSPERRTAALQALNAEACNLRLATSPSRNAGSTIPSCGVSLPLARQIVQKIVATIAPHTQHPSPSPSFTPT